MTMSVEFNRAWAVLKASTEHSVVRDKYELNPYDELARYGTEPTQTRTQLRLGTLHPALQPHPDKSGGMVSRRNMRVSPELDHDPEDILEREGWDALTREQWKQLRDERFPSAAHSKKGGRILAVPTMEQEYPPQFRAPQSLNYFDRWFGRQPDGDVGINVDATEAAIGLPHTFWPSAKNYEDHHWHEIQPWSGYDNEFSHNFEPTVGPALTAQQMEDLREQGGQFLSEFS